jgi:hypothetical protein
LFRDRAAGWIDEASCFFSGVIGVTGCAPPVDFGPGVTPALFSMASLDLAAVVSVFGFAPLVGPLPASSVDTVPFVRPLPASAFGCANAGSERPTAIAEMGRLPRNNDVRGPLIGRPPSQLDLITASFGSMVPFAKGQKTSAT